MKMLALCPGDVVTLADGSKTFQMYPQAIVRIFDDSEIAWASVTPGFSQRVPEFFVPYNWNANLQRFDYEYRGFNGPALLNMGSARVDAPQILETGVAQWIVSDSAGTPPPSTVAQRLCTRQVFTLGGGLLLWRFTTTYAHPELEIGDVVAVRTDRFVAADPIASRPLAGKLWAIGPLVETEPNGKSFGIWIRQWSDISPNPVALTVGDGVTLGNPGDDLLLNGDFEQGLAYWGSSLGSLTVITAASAFKGVYSLQLTYTGTGKASQRRDSASWDNTAALPRYIRVQPGDTMRMTGVAFDSASVPSVGLDAYNDKFVFQSAAAVLTWNTVTNAWLAKDSTWVVPAGIYYVVAYVAGGGGGARIALFDELHFWHRA